MVHGFMGVPNGGWRPWLMGELNKQGVYACALPMPNPDEPILGEWLETINFALKDNAEDVILVGHSLGVPAILQFLMSLPAGKKVAGAVLASGPYKKLQTEDPNSMIRKIDNFFNPEFDFGKIKNACRKFTIIHGIDDDRVPLEHAQFLTKQLDAELIEVPNGGHLNGKSGWNQLPQALEAVNSMM